MTKDKLQNLDILKNNINNPKRNETDSERIERYMFLFENGDKPPHYDDPSINKIDSYQDYGKLREKAAINQDNSNLKTGKPVSREFIREAYPKKYDHFDKSTYPSTGKPQGQISTWDLIKQTAKTTFEKKEIREILHREYKKDKTRLEPDELRMIGKSPEQLKALAAIINKPRVYVPLPDSLTPRVTPIETKSLHERLNEITKRKEGLSDDLVKEQIAINKNIDYVLGNKDQGQGPDRKLESQESENRAPLEEGEVEVTIGDNNE